MYQSLYNFAKSRGIVADLRKEMKLVRAHIVVSDKGDFEYVEVHDKKSEKTPCPSIGSLAFASGSTAYSSPICEKMSTILCGAIEKSGNAIGNEKKYEAWKKIMQEASQSDKNLLPVFDFIVCVDANAEVKQKVYDQLIESKVKEEDWISFSVSSDGVSRNVEKMESWLEWFEEWMSAREKKSESTETVISSITGKPVVPVSIENFPKIMAPQTGTGAYIASFGQNAFQSYGFNDNRNLPMSMEEALTIKAAGEQLLCSQNNHNDNFNTVYWFEKKDPDIENALSGYFRYKEKSTTKEKKQAKENERDFSLLLPAPESGHVKISSRGKNNVFHMMNFNVSSQGRMYFSNERKETYGDLYESLKKWMKDTAIYAPIFKETETEDANEKKYMVSGYAERSIGNAIAVLDCLLNNEAPDNRFEQRKKEYGVNRLKLFEAICFGDDIPMTFFERALRKVTKRLSAGETPPITMYQIIKAYLIRNGGETMLKSELNEEIQNPAYVCGRWFATVEKLQQDSATIELNSTIGSKYYKATKAHPSHYLPELNNLVIIYYSRLRRNKKFGTIVYYEHILTSLSELIGTKMPETLSANEQGMFDLGYYHQKGVLYRKKPDNSLNTDTDNENEKG